MDIYISSDHGICSEFTLKGKKQEITNVIAPIKIEGESDSPVALKVVTGCNMWRDCECAACFYSIAARKKDRVRAQPES